ASYMLGANKRQTFMNIILPASLPDIFTGLRTAIGFEYTTLVAAEMVAAKVGIGWMVLDASNWLKSDVVFAGVIIMGITGILLSYLILFIEKKVVHWAGK
ncbi:MAG: ABC transporter permease subunit, partial [Parasporobacterium sp.]|nr:ABC transporter permease subunit [Parasporobacterium sp.]